MTEEEIKEYINRKDELLLKLSDKDKDTLEWILFGYNECARLLDEKEKENQELKEEKQELIDYLKEQITLCNERIDFHKSEISGVINISDDNRHLILIKKNKIRKESFEEILSKIEKR